MGKRREFSWSVTVALVLGLLLCFIISISEQQKDKENNVDNSVIEKKEEWDAFQKMEMDMDEAREGQIQRRTFNLASSSLKLVTRLIAWSSGLLGRKASSVSIDTAETLMKGAGKGLEIGKVVTEKAASKGYEVGKDAAHNILDNTKKVAEKTASTIKDISSPEKDDEL